MPHHPRYGDWDAGDFAEFDPDKDTDMGEELTESKKTPVFDSHSHKDTVMSKRKTVDVSFLVEKANLILKRTDGSPEYRKGVASILEAVLHETGNYQGFNYVAWCDEGGCERWRKDGGDKVSNDPANESLPTEPYLGDQTRRVYYYTKR